MEAPEGQDRPETPAEGGGEPTRELTAAGGQFLLRADVVEFRRGDLLGGRYQIEKGIGRGATGSVLQAFDRVVRGVVAVKILRPDLATDERWIERLGGELRYARKLQHPNVCRVFDLGEADGHHFLTMEFAGAGSLRQRLADVPDRTWDQRIADARAVIEGLVAIHAANIVHRDVKPENVLVMDDGRLVVSDFGVAVSAGQTTYFSSKVAGTPSYMAPEVIMGDKATPRADVFSLGIVLHEILFGRRPDWQMTPKGRVIKPVVGRKSSTREKAFARLCAECLSEFAPERLADAAAVKRRFEQAVAGRLRPIRGLRTRWPLLVAAVAVVASSALVVGASRRHTDVGTSPGPLVAKLTGRATDLGPISRPIFVQDKSLRCFDILPDRKTARIVWRKPAAVVDVDLATGNQTPSELVPDAFQTGCPQLSPDGKRLLYVKDDDSKRTQIMVSTHPDGRDAVPVTEGSTPAWLPSGEEFVYAFDNRRAAAFTLPKSRLLFPDSPPFEKLLQQIAVNDAGDRVALLFLDSRRKYSVEIYSYPSMTLRQQVALAQTVGGIQFDAKRGTLQLSVPDPASLSLVELTESNELSRFGEIRGTNILNGFRTEPGLALLTWNFSYTVVVDGPDRDRRVLAPAVSGRATAAPNGDVLFDRRLDGGQFVIAYQPRYETTSRQITEGPTDMYPSFSPDGRRFTFVRVDEGAIMSCQLEGGKAVGCHPITSDPLGPRFATISPDGKVVAYQTTNGSSSRLRLVSLEGRETRDLGVYRSTCPPTWSSANALWIQERGSPDWKEIDAVQGRATGRTNRDQGDVASVCDRIPPLVGAGSPSYRFDRLENRATEIRLASAPY